MTTLYIAIGDVFVDTQNDKHEVTGIERCSHHPNEDLIKFNIDVHYRLYRGNINTRLRVDQFKYHYVNIQPGDRFECLNATNTFARRDTGAIWTVKEIENKVKVRFTDGEYLGFARMPGYLNNKDLRRLPPTGDQKPKATTQTQTCPHLNVVRQVVSFKPFHYCRDCKQEVTAPVTIHER